MSEEGTERERLVRRADVLESRLLRSLDALAHRTVVHGVVQTMVSEHARARLKQHARHIALGIGGAIAAIVIFVAAKRIIHRT
jgi:hypothetical protein